MMLSLMAAMLMAMPMQAQNVTNDEVVETQDDTEVADSTMLDSLAADTLRLPWPESVKVGIDNLLKARCLKLRRWVSWFGTWRMTPASTSTTSAS